MAENLDCSTSNLLCSENTSSCFDGDLDFNAMNEFGASPACHQLFKNQILNQNDPFLINNRSTSLIPGFALQSDDVIKEMVEKEMEHLPRDDYLERLRSGDLGLSARREAIEWIWKVCLFCSLFSCSFILTFYLIDPFNRFL